MIGSVIYDVFKNINWGFPQGDPTGCFPSTAQKLTEFPFVVYEVIDREPSPTKDSPDSALDIYTVNITSYSRTYAQSQIMAFALKDAFDAIENNTTVALIQLQSCRFQDQEEDYSEDIEAYLNTVVYKFRVDRSITLDYGPIFPPTYYLPLSLPAIIR